MLLTIGVDTSLLRSWPRSEVLVCIAVRRVAQAHYPSSLLPSSMRRNLYTVLNQSLGGQGSGNRLLRLH